MSCCGAKAGYDQLDEVSRLVAGKLAAFLRTLRDNGFAVGLSEGQDAASLMTQGYAEKPALLRVAFKHLFSARKTDWEKFDGLFDAFWLGKRVRSRSATIGSVRAARRAFGGRPDPGARRRYAGRRARRGPHGGRLARG